MKALIVISCVLTLISANKVVEFIEGENLVDENGDYDSEATMRARAKAAIGQCYQFSDYLAPESSRLAFDVTTTPEEFNPKTTVIFDSLFPRFQVCSPQHTELQGVWKEYHKLVTEELGAEKDIKEVKDKRKENQKRLKVVFVTHPLIRVAQAYAKGFLKKDQGDKNFQVVLKLFKGQHSFREFVEFLIYGQKLFKNNPEVIKSENFNADWAPYYRDCNICHEENFPTFVVKTDDDDTVKQDIAALQEIFGLEDIEFPFEKRTIVFHDQIRALYKHLNKEHLEGLIEMFRVDLKMYQYSPDLFYYMLHDPSHEMKSEE